MALPEWKSCTVEEAATKTGYSKEYIRRLIREKKLLAVKIGTVYFISIESLHKYVEQAKADDDARYGPRREGKS